MKRTILLISVIAVAVTELIDTSIVNAPLSHMSGNLGSILEDTSGVITSYAIANVIIIPMTSFLALKLGRRNYYIRSVIAFTFFSFICGQASGIWMLLFSFFYKDLAKKLCFPFRRLSYLNYFQKKSKKWPVPFLV